MRLLATVSSILATMLLLLPWQVCTCSEDGPHLKSLLSASECEYDVSNRAQAERIEGSRESEEHEHEECDQLFKFAGAEGDLDLDLPRADEVRCLLCSVEMLPRTAGEPHGAEEAPPRAEHEAGPPVCPLQSRTRLLL